MLNNINALPIETSHSSLDFFQRPQQHVIFDRSFEQKIGPLYGSLQMDPRWSLKSEKPVSFIDLQNICLEVKLKL